MKKSVIVLCAFIATLFVVCSCSENSKMSEQHQESESSYEQLELALNAYSDSYVSSTETKGPFWKRLGNIFMCDGIGAAAGSLMGPGGSLFGAVVGSTFRFIYELIDHGLDCQSTQNLVDFYDRSARLYDEQDSLDAADSLGLIHNRLITEILEENPNIMSLSDIELNRIINDKVCEYSSLSVRYSIDDFRTFSLLSKSESSESLYNDALGKYPTLEKELRLVKIYADNVANLEENLIPEYSLGFKEIVEASEIEDSSKEIVKSAVSVTGSSKLMWQEEALLNVSE